LQESRKQKAENPAPDVADVVSAFLLSVFCFPEGRAAALVRRVAATCASSAGT
jgi:hypothetical protein